METKELMIKGRFNSSNRYQLKINKHSKEYEYYEKTINEMIEKKSLSLYDKIKNSLILKYNHCYTNDLGIKERCVNQCEFCKNLQYQKEIFNNNQEIKAEQKAEKDKLKTPSKFKQIINIIFKK